MTPSLLIDNLKVDFLAGGKLVNSPLRGISLSIEAGKTLGIVGETGCGKTLTALSVMGILPASARQSGSISLAGKLLSAEDLALIRGREIAMIFQNPHSAFNPVFTIKQQLHFVAQGRGYSLAEENSLVADRFAAVGLHDVSRVLTSYPYELSGGMLQRCMIAMALLSNPKVLIADEPTTALDATIAKQVLELLRKLQQEQDFAMLFISHDVSAVARVSDTIAVLYAGKVVESGDCESVLKSPKHPYTRGLLGAIPSATKARGTLSAIPGVVPTTTLEIEGCAFASRCSEANSQCRQSPLLLRRGNSNVACWQVH